MTTSKDHDKFTTSLISLLCTTSRRSCHGGECFSSDTSIPVKSRVFISELVAFKNTHESVPISRALVPSREKKLTMHNNSIIDQKTSRIRQKLRTDDKREVRGRVGMDHNAEYCTLE